MLLYIYLGATTFVLYDAIKHKIYLDKRLKKEGYNFTQNNKHFGLFDLVLEVVHITFLLTPIVHLISPLSHLDKDRSYDEYMNYLDEAGAIEKDDNFIDPSKFEEKKIITIHDTKLIDRVNQSGHIYYSPMYGSEEDSLVKKDGKVYKKILK